MGERIVGRLLSVNVGLPKAMPGSGTAGRPPTINLAGTSMRQGILRLRASMRWGFRVTPSSTCAVRRSSCG
jgi:hypothetical protein